MTLVLISPIDLVALLAIYAWDCHWYKLIKQCFWMAQAAGLVPGSGAAADLLGRIGVWNPHDNIGLRQLDLTADFPPALQAWPFTTTLLQHHLGRRKGRSAIVVASVSKSWQFLPPSALKCSESRRRFWMAAHACTSIPCTLYRSHKRDMWSRNSLSH